MEGNALKSTSRSRSTASIEVTSTSTADTSTSIASGADIASIKVISTDIVSDASISRATDTSTLNPQL